MRFSVITIVAAMVSVVAAQNCGGPCGTATIAGVTTTLLSCAAGCMCGRAVAVGLPGGIARLNLGVSGGTIY